MLSVLKHSRLHLHLGVSESLNDFVSAVIMKRSMMGAVCPRGCNRGKARRRRFAPVAL